MCILLQGVNNSITHMMNDMHKALKDLTPHITMPFLDDAHIKGCEERAKDKELLRPKSLCIYY